MKKFVALILVIITCLSLYACKSDAAKACETLINQIGTVTLDSEKAIIDAEAAYNALSAEEKEQIAESGTKLKNYRKTFDEEYLPIKKVITSIDGIGEVTSGSGSKIDEANKLYNALTSKQKEQIKDHRDKLSTAKASYVACVINEIGEITLDSGAAISRANVAYGKLSSDEKNMIKDAGNTLKNAQQKFNALEVIATIDSIGTVTLDSKPAIEKATQKYDALTSAEKNLVTNHGVLESAMTKYNSLAAAEEKRLRNRFWTKTDKVEGITWYYHDNHPYYISAGNFMLPYIGVRNNGHAWLVLKFNYHSGDWIFWETARIVVDGKSYYYSPGYFNVNREAYRGYVSETSHDTNPDIEMLKAIVNSKETIIRFQGDDYHRDYTVTKSDKTIIKETLALYEILKTK